MNRRKIKICIAAILMALVLVCNVAESTSNHSAPAPAVNCTSLVWNLANCSSFLTRGSTNKKPETSCCSGLKTVVKIDADCLCEAFNNSDQLGFTHNKTRVWRLPAACNFSAPSFSNCTRKMLHSGRSRTLSGAALLFRNLFATATDPAHSFRHLNATAHASAPAPAPAPAPAIPYRAVSAPAAAPAISVASATAFHVFSGPDPAPAPAPAPDIFGDTGGYLDGYNENRTSGGLAIGLPLAATLIVMLLVICRYYRNKNPSNKQKENQNLDCIIKRHGFSAPKRYSYSQIKKMTNSFRNKLGEGGFGEVYRGTLIDGDGSPVAVKILKATKVDGEEFINEVVNISRTSHINVVTLLGFCIDRKKRALVYEFMPNGSLEKYIYKENMSKSSTSHLGWDRLYQIALGVARGLEYLHRGCNTRILHFDIKPHNILLDQDFCPKISDFGLAKQCTRKESIISMLETRGTIGYIAPEVISRNFGGVSHKSDVYSYGMMLLEMVGGRKNIYPQVSNTSEIYFPHWAYQRMVVGEDLKLQGVTTGEDNEIAKKMIIVGVWCIQNDPLQRPAMSKVIEMLQGRLDSLEIPPKPFFGSPSRSEPDFFDNAGDAIIEDNTGL